MSRGQRARTPENFPRMKHRAAGRLIKRDAAMKAPGIFQAFSKALDTVADAVSGIINAYAHAIRAAFRPATRDDYALTPDGGEA